MIYTGNSLDILKTIPDCIVDCCITSPPYWGLRDYGTATWQGGDPDCKHNPQKPDGGERSDRAVPLGRGAVYKTLCAKCGAIRIDQQLGQESTFEQYIATMTEVFREIRRVLKDDGTLWLNLGDTYVSTAQGTMSDPLSKDFFGCSNHRAEARKRLRKVVGNLKPKDLVGIPWRVAFALQADGWYLRQDIIWQKPNPMPESVTDRCTKSHEYIFLLSKSARYYYDADAVREVATGYDGRQKLSTDSPKYANGFAPNTTDDKAVKGHERWKRKYDDTNTGSNGTGFQNHSGYSNIKNPYVRNKRSVWTVTTKPFKGSHFATFPKDLIRPMVLTTRKDAVILDPFFGSGTTGLVALECGRKYVGIELNPDYVKMATDRINSYLEQQQIELT